MSRLYLRAFVYFVILIVSVAVLAQDDRSYVNSTKYPSDEFRKNDNETIEISTMKNVTNSTLLPETEEITFDATTPEEENLNEDDFEEENKTEQAIINNIEDEISETKTTPNTENTISPDYIDVFTKLIDGLDKKEISPDIYKITPNFIKDINSNGSGFKSILTDLFEKGLQVTPKIITLGQQNTTMQVKPKSKESYGVSVLLSSDIFSLRSVVEDFDPALCKNESLKMFNGLLRGDVGALKMYDASAKSPVGLLYGDTYQLGNFDECLDVGTKDDSDIKGQYCLAHVDLPKHTLPTFKYEQRYGPTEKINWAVCVPASCPAITVEKYLSTLLTRSSIGGKIRVPERNCRKVEPIKVDNGDIAFVSIVGIFIIFVLACTFFHVYLHHRCKSGYKFPKSMKMKALLSFSLVKNVKKIFNVDVRNDLGLEAVSGIKVVSMLIILTGHTILHLVTGPVTNTIFYDEMMPSVQNAIWISNPLLVDSFLLLSAFLFSRLLLLEYEKRNGNVSVIPIYIMRYLRLTPAYLVIIALNMTWLDKMDDGPLWNRTIQVQKERCMQSWWTNLLCINNYVNSENMCMFQSWYLSVDTQLFFIAPALIYPLWKKPKFGEYFLGLAIVISILVPIFVTYSNGYDPTLLPFPKEFTDLIRNFFFQNVYIKTHMRASPYFAGILCGYILHKIQSTGYKFDRNTLWTYWIVAIICGLGSVYSISYFMQPDYKYEALTSALYSSLHKVAWSVFTGWLLIVCCTKNFGPLERIFLWKPFTPICRLTYCAYLVNGIVESHALGTLRNSVHLNVYNMLTICISHVVLTFSWALLLCLLFESPIHGFEKILLKALVDKNKKQSDAGKETLEEVEVKS